MASYKTQTFSLIYFLFLLSHFSCTSYQQSSNQISKTPVWKANNESFLIANLQESLKRYPKDASIHNHLAKLYLETEKDSLALFHIQKALSIDSTNATYFLTLSNIHQYAQRIDLALPTAQIARQLGYKGVDLWISLGYCYFFKNQFKDGQECINLASETLDENDYRLLFLKSFGLPAKDSAQSVALLKKCLEKMPEFTTGYLVLNNIYRGRNDKNQAVIQINRGLSYKHNSKQLFLQLADTYNQFKMEDSASYFYQKVIQINPRQYEALYPLAYINYKKGKYNEAEALFKTALSIKDNVSELNYYYALCLLQKNKENDAMLRFKKAYELDPKLLEAKEFYEKLRNKITLSQKISSPAYQDSLRKVREQKTKEESRKKVFEPNTSAQEKVETNTEVKTEAIEKKVVEEKKEIIEEKPKE